MATIVRHRRTGNEYILLSINGEANKTNPSRLIDELFNREKAETSSSATICDSQGNLFLAYIDDLVVTEIDGQKPADILPEPTFTEPGREYIPEPSADFDEEELADEDWENSTRDRDSLEIPTDRKPDSQSNLDREEEDDEDWI